LIADISYYFVVSTHALTGALATIRPGPHSCKFGLNCKFHQWELGKWSKRQVSGGCFNEPVLVFFASAFARRTIDHTEVRPNIFPAIQIANADHPTNLAKSVTVVWKIPSLRPPLILHINVGHCAPLLATVQSSGHFGM